MKNVKHGFLTEPVQVQVGIAPDDEQNPKGERLHHLGIASSNGIADGYLGHFWKEVTPVSHPTHIEGCFQEFQINSNAAHEDEGCHTECKLISPTASISAAGSSISESVLRPTIAGLEFRLDVHLTCLLREER